MLAVLLVMFTVLALRHGWIVDDAYITMRTVDNLFAGLGLVWNVGERVQAFTHPLWLLLCCGLYALTDEFFYSLIVMGALLSTAGLAFVAVRIARTEQLGVALIILASLSHAFVDYSTSGLENPLTHLLLAAAVWVYLRELPSARQFGLLCLIGGLSILTRPDNPALLAPMVVVAGVQAWRRGVGIRALAKAAALASLPLLAWELFSLFYYGLLVPNTALAKLNMGIPKAELVAQGLFYLVATLEADPLTLVVIAAGVVVPIVTRDRRTAPLAAGIVLHMIYLVSIGGDFMLGRFLTAPLFMALIVLSRTRGLDSMRVAGLTVALAALGLASNPSTFAVDRETSEDPARGRTLRHVTDERVLFFEGASLLSAYRTRDMPDHAWRWSGQRGAPEGKRTRTAITMGFRGLEAGPDLHLIDSVALTDPLLARLPARYNPTWMTGHYIRAIPAGYVETLETGDNVIRDRNLADVYDRVDLVVHGPLWSWARVEAIWWLNTGGPKRRVDVEKYRFKGALKLDPDELAKPVPDGTSLGDKRVRSFANEGVSVRFGDRQDPAVIAISLNEEDRFELRLYDGDEEIASVAIPSQRVFGHEGLSTRVIELPEPVRERGFTRLRVLPRSRAHEGKRPWVIGHLALDPVPEPVAKAGSKPGSKPAPKAKG